MHRYKTKTQCHGTLLGVLSAVLIFLASGISVLADETVPAPEEKNVVSESQTNTDLPDADKNKRMSGGGIAVLVVMTLGAIYMFTNRSSRRAEQRLTRTYEATLFEDVASAVKEDADIPADRLQALLAPNETAKRPLAGELSSIIRIEYSLQKIDPHQVRRIVRAAIDRDGSLVKKNVSRDYPWEDLPRQERSKFIMEQKDSFTYLLYQVNGKEAECDADRQTD